MTQEYKAPVRCVHCIVSGRVQGVFYRANTQLKAKKLGITGWVKNCDDGTVELMACGEPESIEHLIKWLQQGPPMAKVKKVIVEEQPIEFFEDFIIDR